MSQSNFSIPDETGALFRADTNTALQALASANSGATAPATTYPFQVWADTTTNTLKIRNGANTVWMVMGAFDTTNDRWEVNTNVVQALTTAGVTFKNAAGTTIGTLTDAGLFTPTGGISTGGTLTLGGVLDANSHQVRLSQGAAIASAATLTLGADGNTFSVTGTTTITAIASVAIGTTATLIFAGALTLTNSASLILPGGANITTAAGDVATVVQTGASVWTCTSYMRVDGTAVVAAPSSPGLKSTQIFLASGTWTKPAGVTKVKVYVTGAGGGPGGGSGYSAGAGATGISMIDVASISSATITVGASGGNYSNGGNSIWSDGTNTITGGGGSYSASIANATGADINLNADQTPYSFWGFYGNAPHKDDLASSAHSGIVYVEEY